MTALTARRAFPFFLLIALTTCLEGCRAVAGIFKAGVWVGLVLAIVIVGVVLVLITKMRR